MSEIEREDRFRFVPFAAQPIFPREHRLANPRSHHILLEADFLELELPDLNDVYCDACESPVKREVGEFQRGWGHIERLVCVIPDVPQLKCQCLLFVNIEDLVYQRMEPARDTINAIYRAIESSDRGDLVLVKEKLIDEDFRKVKDFIDNRWVHPASGTAWLRERKSYTGNN